MKVRSLVLAGILTTSPLTGAFAQGGTGPQLKADSTQEAKDVKNGSAANPNQGGATGSTVVPGDNSTVAKDQTATGRTQSGGGGGK